MPFYTIEQVKTHCKPDDVWIILHNKVYDVTKYLDDHPGGSAVLIEVAGSDATEAFEEIGHSDEAQAKGPGSNPQPPRMAPLYADRQNRSRTNVYHLVFALPDKESILGLPTGQHVALRATINGSTVSRSYTPISNNTDLGRVELLIKTCPNGQITQHLAQLPVGSTIDIRGPKGAMKYSTHGSDVKTVLAPGTVHTPKQLVVDDNAWKVYFCDREGMSIHRCAFDGSQHEILVRTGRLDSDEHRGNMTRWCVGIAIDTVRGYVYWTQEGPPEPIDLELDQESQQLYWTDRGEHPLGCSLNRVDLNGLSEPGGASCRKGILARHFNEPIGLKLGRQGEAYVVNLGGSVYQVKHGKMVLRWTDNRCYTGISL